MSKTLKQFGEYARLVVATLLGLYGAYGLFQWWTTGRLWINLSSGRGVSDFQYISFADHPVTLVAVLAAHVLFAAIGCAAGVLLVRKLRHEQE